MSEEVIYYAKNTYDCMVPVYVNINRGNSAVVSSEGLTSAQLRSWCRVHWPCADIKDLGDGNLLVTGNMVETHIR